MYSGLRRMLRLYLNYFSSFRACQGWWRVSRSSPGTIPSELLNMLLSWPGRRVVKGSRPCTRPTSCEWMCSGDLESSCQRLLLIWPLCSCRKLGDGLFLQCCREVAAGYPDIAFDSMIVDNTTMQVMGGSMTRLQSLMGHKWS